METARKSAVPALAGVLLAACGGSGAGLDANGRPLGPDGIGVFEPTLDSIQDHVFTPICAQCHVGAGAPQGLVLSDAQSSYDHLVAVPSTQSPSWFRVLPGDADASFLIHKLEGTQDAGNQMPNGCPVTQPCLDHDSITIIRAWIDAGAAGPAP